ncbi:hypothetical protein IPH92_01470 [Candidatus Kaiserbacteria bacterium]|nr:MAG: hypothetical protein IPH92_01470 [Candidatus Kaiserbacteria bacterium]
MAHPFEKMFLLALKKSNEEENLVLKEAEKLIHKGYAPNEIHDVLSKLAAGLISDKEVEVITDALEELGEQFDFEDDVDEEE